MKMKMESAEVGAGVWKTALRQICGAIPWDSTASTIPSQNTGIFISARGSICPPEACSRGASALGWDTPLAKKFRRFISL